MIELINRVPYLLPFKYKIMIETIAILVALGFGYAVVFYIATDRHIQKNSKKQGK